MKQRTSITFETGETVILREGRAVVRGICPQFGGRSALATPEAFSVMANMSEREIFRLIERGKLCFIEADRVLVCLKCFQKSAISKAAGNSFQLGE